MSIPTIRNAIAEHLKSALADSDIVYSTAYQPVIELTESQTAITVQPVSLTAAFADRMRYTVEPTISITVMKRLGEDREAAGDHVLEMVDKVINVTIGVTFAGSVVKTCDIADPILLEDSISNQNVAASQIVLSLYSIENRS